VSDDEVKHRLRQRFVFKYNRHSPDILSYYTKYPLKRAVGTSFSQSRDSQSGQKYDST
jgi:hypothetical protein